MKTIPYMTRADAGRELGVTITTVSRWVAEGKLHDVVTCGPTGIRLVPKADVMRLKAARERGRG